ncbi:subtilisin-like serine protease [Apophysomyces sp. BC1034]|nr:subtilisin-like serine protease [Apophysomyces sp. BC1015]KAG0183448.1 subtilisin-like serine protease [Apophysomyces sp. BC1021]KAG0193814.1 subtilisin-like serine protease [Apophysomyces sp. BC1034]
MFFGITIILILLSRIGFAAHVALFNSLPSSGLLDSHTIRHLTFDENTHFLIANTSYDWWQRHPDFILVEQDRRVKVLNSDILREWESDGDSQLDLNENFGHIMMQKDVSNWGLARIGQRQLPLGKTYEYPVSAGEGVDIYIIDTGVNTKHVDFDDRAEWGTTVIDGEADCLDDKGDGSISDIIHGLHFVMERAHLRQPKKAVVNMSIGADKSDALNQAIDALVRMGIVVVAAAGNTDPNNTDRNACDYSPSSAPNALVVGATDQNDNIASFSHSGPCIDLFAPGSGIVSDGGHTNQAKVISSGTSFSAPFVAGTAALLLTETTNATAIQVKDHILTTGTADVLQVADTSPNLLLYTGLNGAEPAGTLASWANRNNSKPSKTNPALFLFVIILVLMT